MRGLRRVQRYGERNEAEVLHKRRYLDCRRHADGSVRVEARLSPDVGEMLLKALEAADAELGERVGDAESTAADADAESAESAVPSRVSAEIPPALFTLPPRPDAVPPGVSAETPRRLAAPNRPAAPSGWRLSMRHAG